MLFEIQIPNPVTHNQGETAVMSSIHTLEEDWTQYECPACY